MKHPKSYDSTPETRKRMGKVKLKGGKAESMLAKALWHRGYRYRRNDKRLPGSPDIAILKYRIAVFVDGEFWHGKDWGTRKKALNRNREYWIEKIEENMARDYRNDILLRQMDWISVHIGELDVLHSLPKCVLEVEEAVAEQLATEMEDVEPLERRID